MKSSEEWKKVSYAADCIKRDPTDEVGEICSVCKGDYVDCPCPGPTMDEYEYEYFNNELFAKLKIK